MKVLISAVAMLALLGFMGSVHAKDASSKASKAHPGHFVKIDGKQIVFKGGAKGTGHDHTVAFDDSTKFSIDGKDSTEAEFEKNVKADEYVEITTKKTDPADKTKVVATAIEAFTVAPVVAPTSAPAHVSKPDSK